MTMRRRGLLAAMLALLAQPAAAQTTTPPDLMIVLDGSGSMWGRIGDRTKIEIARDTLSSVLGEVNQQQNIGMITYGHRVRGQCSDIELVVPLAPASSAVPEIIAAARGLNPIGMTPLSDAVRQAADHLRFTERAATVVLITDGIETCDADPCALGTELARLGLDFTAHVVGFGMSEEEGAQVACLADNTGGAFFLANDPDALADALAQTLGDPDDFIPEPVEQGAREVHFLLRETAGDELLRGAPLLELAITAEAVAPPDALEIPTPSVAAPFSASGAFEPGPYVLEVAVKANAQRTLYTARLPFVVEPGEGPQIIDRVIGARLKIVPMISAGEPFSRGLPSATFGHPHLDFKLTPVINGQPVAADTTSHNAGAAPTGDGVLELRLSPGTWLVQGILGRVFAREKLIEVLPGETTELVFDFEASRVFFDFRDNGVPVRTPTFYPYDGPSVRAWAEARFHNGDGVLLPLFMPEGTWLLRGGDYHNAQNRGAIIVNVPGGGESLSFVVSKEDEVPEDDLLLFSEPGYRGCLERLGSSESGPCLIEQVAF